MLTLRGQQHSFSTHERVFLWKCQSFCFETENVSTWGGLVRRWMQQNLTNEKSILVQAWCSHAISHKLNQCSPRFLISHDVTSPQWVKPLLTNIHIKCGDIQYTPMIIHMVRLYCVLWFRISQRYPANFKDYTHGKWKKIYQSWYGSSTARPFL